MVRTIWLHISNALRDFSKNAKWHAEEWATNLSTLLQDEALEVYSRLSIEDTNDYVKLRDALLK